MKQKDIEKILIIRLDRLGDTLLSTPVITALKNTYKNAKISFVASPLGAKALEGDKRIDRLFVFDMGKAGFFEKVKFAGLLKREKFDAVINISEKIWPHFWTWYSKSPVRSGFFPGFSQPFKSIFLPLVLSHRVYSPNNPSSPSLKHEVERYMELLAPLNIYGEAGKLTLNISDDEKEKGKEYLLNVSGKKSYHFVALHLSPKWAIDGWSKDFPVKLAKFLLDKKEKFFIMGTYGPGEKKWVGPLISNFPKERFSLYFGRDFSEWISIMSQCSSVITMDTGTVHVAAALGLPVVDIFSEINFEHCSKRWSPWKVPGRVIKRDVISLDIREEDRLALEDELKRSILVALESFL